MIRYFSKYAHTVEHIEKMSFKKHKELSFIVCVCCCSEPAVACLLIIQQMFIHQNHGVQTQIAFVSVIMTTGCEEQPEP